MGAAENPQLPLTDVVVNPHDGALYFTVGGRRTQSGLYRVTYVGSGAVASLQYTGTADTSAAEARSLRCSFAPHSYTMLKVKLA